MNLEDVILRDTRANQPAVADVAAGTIYFVTDELVTERSNGSAWEDISDAGSVGVETDPVFGAAEAHLFVAGDKTKLDGIAAGATNYTDEKAQDAVGAMADADSLVYIDAIPLLAVKNQMSITADGSGLKLDGDSATPGNNKVYGSDASGVKGWKNDPSGSASELIQVTLNLTDAQTKSLNTVPIQILPAQGALKAAIPVRLAVYKDSSAGGYSGAQTLRVRPTGVATDIFAAISFVIETLARTSFNTRNPAEISAVTTVADWINKAIDVSSSGDVTGGNAANVIKIRMTYFIVDFN